MAEYAPQVDKSHYTKGSYRSRERWVSYWHQLSFVRSTRPGSVLEVGPGEGVVTAALRREGVIVTTLDISPDVSPDVVGSVTRIPLVDASFDTAVCAEVLEHIRFADVPQALRELRRVVRGHVVVSLPHPGYVFAFGCKLPLLPQMQVLFQIPFFWETHHFNGEHYWELGKRGTPVREFVRLAQAAGLQLQSQRKSADDPVHRLFLFSVL